MVQHRLRFCWSSGVRTTGLSWQPVTGVAEQDMLFGSWNQTVNFIILLSLYYLHVWGRPVSHRVILSLNDLLNVSLATRPPQCIHISIPVCQCSGDGVPNCTIYRGELLVTCQQTPAGDDGSNRWRSQILTGWRSRWIFLTCPPSFSHLHSLLSLTLFSHEVERNSSADPPRQQWFATMWFPHMVAKHLDRCDIDPAACSYLALVTWLAAIMPPHLQPGNGVIHV